MFFVNFPQIEHIACSASLVRSFFCSAVRGVRSFFFVDRGLLPVVGLLLFRPDDLVDLFSFKLAASLTIFGTANFSGSSSGLVSCVLHLALFSVVNVDSGKSVGLSGFKSMDSFDCKFDLVMNIEMKSFVILTICVSYTYKPVMIGEAIFFWFRFDIF